MFSWTMAFVSAVTWKGSMSQHQSPSKKTLGAVRRFSSWQTVVLPTPMGPPIKYRRFMADISPLAHLLGVVDDVPKPAVLAAEGTGGALLGQIAGTA